MAGSDSRIRKLRRRRDEEHEMLMKLGESIGEIYFSEIPEFSILEALAESDFKNNDGKARRRDQIIFHLPLNKVAGSIDEYADSTFSGNIHSVNLETDLFMEWGELYSLPNLKKLVLTCTNREATYLDDNDLEKMQLALHNLTNLQVIYFDIEKMQGHIIERVKEIMNFPSRKMEVEFRSTRKTRGKRLR